MTKKQEQADYAAEAAAEKAAEAKYPTDESPKAGETYVAQGGLHVGDTKPAKQVKKAVEVEMPARFETGGATFDEKAAWIAENRPEPLVETAKCGPQSYPQDLMPPDEA